MDMAQRLQELRRQAGYSQEQAAELIGVSRQAVGKWESGQGKPDLDNVVRLTEIYGVSADYLLTGKESSPAPEPVEEMEVPDPFFRRLLAAVVVIFAVALSGVLFIGGLSLITRYLS